MIGVKAGFYEFGKLGEITEEHFDKTFDTNVRGLLFTVQKALPLMTKGSSVILTGSIAPINGFLSLSVYNASKAAVRSFARSWIVDLKGRDIRVATVPLGRTGTPYDLGKPAVFLASDDSAYATGIELFVDGGVGQI